MTLDRNAAAARMVTAVRDWSLGYGQGTGTGGRWDIRNGGAADCSSLVSWALNGAGLAPTLSTDTYTGNLRARLVTHGWHTLSPATVPQIGDVLLWEGHHTAMCVAAGTLAEAWLNELGTLTGGRPGDQTGQETRLIAASTHPYRGRWTHLLRPPATPTHTAPAAGGTQIGDDMFLLRNPRNGAVQLVTALGVKVGVPNPEYYRVAQKMCKGTLDPGNIREYDVANQMTDRINNATTAYLKKVK